MGGKPVNFERDTIYALATAPGRAGVAIIRVSGPNAENAIRALTSRGGGAVRKAVLRTLINPLNGISIDQSLVLFFKGPNSFTGEDIVEFQVHGGQAVQAAVISVLGTLPGFRLAEAGEFTRRAVENGRLDLTQAEAIADLVDAETEAQRRLAIDQYGGSLGKLYEDWRGRLIRAAAWIEAGIDFADEAVPDGVVSDSHRILAQVLSEIESHLDDGRRGEILREGFHIAVIGPPNVGKSSLVNALARRDVAIVSEIPGTTRDIIEVRLDLGGYPVILADTAGLRDSADSIEQEGVKRARSRAKAADMRLFLLDGTSDGNAGLAAETLEKDDLIVWNKADLVLDRTRPGVWISAKTGFGLKELVDNLAKRASERLISGETPVLTRARHREALEAASKDLAKAIGENEPELAAEHVRFALRSIGRITGRVDLDELLDVVFRDFCIGK